MCNPFKSKRCNHLEYVSLYSLTATLYLALFLSPSPPDAVVTMLSLSLLILNLVLLAYFVGHLTNEIALMLLFKLDDIGNRDGKISWKVGAGTAHHLTTCLNQLNPGF